MATWGYQSHEARAETASGLPASVPIRDLRRIRLEPDDRLAILVKDSISREEAERIQLQAKRILGIDNQVIVLDCGTDLAAVSESVARVAQ
jgi:hypothetical protein